MALDVRLYAGQIYWVGLQIRQGLDEAGEVARMAKAVSFLKGLSERMQDVSLPAPTATPGRVLELRMAQLGVWVRGSAIVAAFEALVVHVSSRF